MADPTPGGSLDHPPFARAMEWARAPLVRAFGVTPEARIALVHHMLVSHLDAAAMYWLQLVLAMAIATLGLALGSSAVVLGAMLISPLMTPVVEFGMGLAVGSPLLVLRSFVRVAASVALVLVGAALITLALPFHEVTAPIASRTSPTALDLLVSICCALMASFAVATSRSNATTTAAGTAVAIALVPPLCVVGFGLGTRMFALARGAGLLFVASFSAIMLFAVLTFTVLGFGTLDVAQLERTTIAESTKQSVAVARLRMWLGGRSGGLLRLLLPLLLLAMVYVPLRRALEEVAWEVRARQAVASVLHDIAGEVVHSSVDVGDHRVRVDFVVVDDPQRAVSFERAIALRLSAATGVVADVHATAVPNAASVHEALRLAHESKPEPVVLPELRQSATRLSETLTRQWPADAAGALFDWRLDVDSTGGARIEVVHFGGGLGRAGEQMLERDLSAVAGGSVRVHDVALPSEPESAPVADGARWLGHIVPVLDNVARLGSLYACVGVPALPSSSDGGHSEVRSVEATRDRVIDAAERVPGERARVVPDATWTLRVLPDACPGPEPSADGGPSNTSSTAPTDGSVDGAHD